jgi:hypothetical protein
MSRRGTSSGMPDDKCSVVEMETAHQCEPLEIRYYRTYRRAESLGLLLFCAFQTENCAAVLVVLIIGRSISADQVNASDSTPCQ